MLKDHDLQNHKSVLSEVSHGQSYGEVSVFNELGIINKISQDSSMYDAP